MVLESKRVIFLLFIISSYSTTAQVIEYKEAKPVTYDKFHVEISVGASVSKLHNRPYNDANVLISPYGEIAVVLPFSARWRIRTGINYQVIGNSSKFIGSASQNGTANRKLPYLSAQIQVGYLISRPTNRLQFELQGGFFGAKQLDDVTLTRIPNQPVSRAKSIDSSIGTDYGIVSGISLSTMINRHNRLGIKFLYHQGLIDIRTLTAKQVTGELPTVTQAFALCTFVSI